MTTTSTRIVSLLVLFFSKATLIDAFTSSGISIFRNIHASSSSLLREGEDNQAEYGKSLELPDSYVRCGKCQTIYALKPEDLGARGKGRRLECSVCDHSWFQSIDRIMTKQDGFEMVERPEWELERIALNIKERKPPAFFGDAKLYVGNIAFECEEKDIYELFSTVGSVGDVSLVRDDDGRNRGFGFICMRTKEQGAAAMEQLNGAELLGRNIAVRESNN